MRSFQRQPPRLVTTRLRARGPRRRCEVAFCTSASPASLKEGRSVGWSESYFVPPAARSGSVGRPTRALSRGLPEEGRSVDRSDPKFASERCARRVGRSQVVYQYYRGYMHICVVSVRLASQGNRVKIHAKTLVSVKESEAAVLSGKYLPDHISDRPEQ